MTIAQTKLKTISLRGARSAGFSLIELMVGLLISLLGTLAMLSAFAHFEGQKRTTTAGNDAQENGSFATYELERVIRSAGSGMAQGKNYNLSGCPLQARLANSTLLPHPGAFPAPFASFPQAVQAIPVLVQSGGGTTGSTNPDVIAVIAGNPSIRVFAAAVLGSTTSTSLVLDNGIGVFQGDYVLSAPVAGNCVLGPLGANTPASPATYAVASNNVPLNGFVGANRVLDMGPQPLLALYGVNTASTPSTLSRYDMLTGTSAAVADGIVMIKALYGVDDGIPTPGLPGSGTAGDGVIDEWVQPVGPTWGYSALMAGTSSATNAISQIKAIRLVVVAQSQLPERASDYTGSATLDLFADMGALKYTMTTSPQFRYKVYDTTIPIRNAFVNRFF